LTVKTHFSHIIYGYFLNFKRLRLCVSVSPMRNKLFTTYLVFIIYSMTLANLVTIPHVCDTLHTSKKLIQTSKTTLAQCFWCHLNQECCSTSSTKLNNLNLPTCT